MVGSFCVPKDQNLK